ncbi:MAG: futalosine hydrolase [Desulfuromonadaceae bacterium]|nr:futalosine hydrolase [Desulfuromonadaceae bacterium]MDD2854041.1 futalosine hydrolase [Desulfuromonadaceae bacterium]
MQPIVIIAAVPAEIELLEKALEYSGRVKSGGYEYMEGTIGNLRVVVSAGGVGKVNAAAVSAVMIDRYHPQLVINTGCAGAYIGSGLTIGNLVVASEEMLGDEGVTEPGGWKGLRYMNITSIEQGGLCCYNSLPLSRHASEKAMQLADYYGVFLMRGRSVTVSTCSGTKLRGSELSKQWSAVMENMEGAAVAQVCLRCGVSCLEIRGISNIVDDRDPKKWDIPKAVEAAQRFILKYIEEMDRPEIAFASKVTPEL